MIDQRIGHYTMTRAAWQFTISCLLLLWAVSAFGQAGLLPIPNQQFFDNNGDPLSSGTVTTYASDGTTPKTTWTNAAEGATNTNPINLDAGGRATIYGTGTYSLVVKDVNGVQIQQGASVAPLTSATPITDNTPIGVLMPFAGMTAPANYVFAYGQAVSRTTYASAFSAMTLSVTTSCASGSPTVAVTDTTQIPIGGAVEASCFVPGTVVNSKTSSSVTLSNNATASISTGFVFFAFGDGDGSTTFNMPDMRGRNPTGRNNMGGSAGSFLTSTYYGISPNATGAAGGSQNETLAQANLPVVNFTVTFDTQKTYHFKTSNTAAGSDTVNAASASSGVTDNQPDVSSTGSFTAHAASGGSATPVATVAPALTVNYIVKIQ